MVDPAVQLSPDSRRLNIFANDGFVGTLQEAGDLWSLAYDQAWAERADSFDLSPALPRSQLLHRDGATVRPVQWYFDNLLPEENLRKLIAADAKLRDHQDSFALLEYLGAEPAGSLTLLPPGQAPGHEAQLAPLPHEELSRRIQGLPRTTLTRESPKRMSLAGAQHKMAAVLKGSNIYEPVGAAPSTHILKPDHPARETYPASTYLEWLTMRLAAAAGLEVPYVALLHVPQPVYAIDRFDRLFAQVTLAPYPQDTPAAVQRVHIIDTCQLLNKSRLFKHAGADVKALRDAAQACGDTLTMPVRLFRWLVFNLLVANDDCHLKNLSFIVSHGRIDLAPHYDLLATGVYHTRAFANDHARWPAVPLAVRLSPDVTHFDQVTPDAVVAAGVELGLSKGLAVRTARDVVKRVTQAFNEAYAQNHLEDSTPRKITQRAWLQTPLTPQENGQHLKILRVLGHEVLPEMALRILP